MPNGGSDCCGTCWFNSNAGGTAGYPSGPLPTDVRCVIRDFGIENPFYTYCANHPHHNPDRVEVPIGPVYHAVSHPNNRQILRESPDTEEVRLGLLEILSAMQEVPLVEYPSPTQLDEEVIKQLMAFRERRASPTLRKIADFDPMAAPSGDNPFERNRMAAVALAIEALGAIERDEALDALDLALRSGLPDDGAASPSEGLLARLRAFWSRGRREASGDDPLAPIRYHAVLGLKHCTSNQAQALLRRAAQDPHPELAALASAILDDS